MIPWNIYLQSSALVAEQGQVHVFPTTSGYKATSGFNLAATSPFKQASKHVSSQPVQLPPQPHQVDSLHKPQTTPQAGIAPSKIIGEPQSVGAASVKSTLSAPNSVGWKGLFEISRNSGTSGVMGYQSMVDDTNNSKDCQIEVCATAHVDPSIRSLVKSVVRGLKACQEPEKPQEGMGGTYFFANENGKKVAILKPCDEEPLAPNNPKGYVGRALGDPGWKPTVRVGEAAMREVAAYLLDHGGFAKVPTSVLVRARHPIFCYNNRMSSVRASSMDLGAEFSAASSTNLQSTLSIRHDSYLPMKLGSLQEFVSSECDTSEMGPARFSVTDVHRIGILDVRLFNTDRHAGNMLVRPSKESSTVHDSRMRNETRELVPIDHGFCLPETLEAPYFEWLHWTQAMQPFSDEELLYIQNLDVEADKELLRKELPNLRPDCLRVLELGTTLLKLGAAQGLTLFEIASIMSRPFGEVEEEPSELEKICMAACQIIEACKALGAESGSEYDDDEEFTDDEVGFEIEIQSNVQLLTAYQEKCQKDTVFELEEDVDGVRYLRFTYANDYDADSPSPLLSASSSSLTSSEGLSDAMTALAETMILTPTLTPEVLQTTPFGKNIVARSVCMTDNFLHRQTKSRRRTNALKRFVTKRPASPHAYLPQPGAGTDATTISFTDMDEVEWSSFMAGVTRSLEDGMAAGKFKTEVRARDVLASSCPKF
eukprot:gene19973-26684_t